jgi:hypothetical protein
VPVIMKLLGDANWWIPGRLRRRLPTLDAGQAPSASARTPSISRSTSSGSL